MGDTQPDSADKLRQKLRSVENHVAALVKLMEKKGNMKCFDLYEKKLAEMAKLRDQCAKLPAAPTTSQPSSLTTLTPSVKRKPAANISPAAQAKRRKDDSSTAEIDKKIRAARNHIQALEKLQKRPGKAHLKVVLSARRNEVKALQLARAEANRRKALAIRLEKSQKAASSSQEKAPVDVSVSSPASTAPLPTHPGAVVETQTQSQTQKKVKRELFIHSQSSSSSSQASQESLFLV